MERGCKTVSFLFRLSGSAHAAYLVGVVQIREWRSYSGLKVKAPLPFIGRGAWGRAHQRIGLTTEVITTMFYASI